eukprot:1666585-Pyramimonas_sp.AAC.1
MPSAADENTDTGLAHCPSRRGPADIVAELCSIGAHGIGPRDSRRGRVGGDPTAVGLRAVSSTSLAPVRLGQASRDRRAASPDSRPPRTR